MNKIQRWFYDKAKIKMNAETIECGLSIIDEEKFDKKIRDVARKDVIYSVIFFLLILSLIIKWLVV